MDLAIFTELLKACGVLGIALLFGVFLRAKLRFLQNLFIPASLIGGALLLAFGQLGFGLIRLNDEWINIWRLLPAVLIVPIVASVPLGLRGAVKSFGVALPLAALIFGVSMLQFAIGLSSQLVFSGEFYPTFGMELGIGFAGGHGTAGFLASILENMGLEYWAKAQSVAIATATVGLIGGVIIGMIFINIACRKGLASVLKSPATIDESFKIGIERNEAKRPILGCAAVLESSADALAVHAAIIFGVCALAYWLKDLLKPIAFIGSFSIWGIAMLLMFALYQAMCALKIDYLIDVRIKSRISAAMTDFAVVAAIASMDLRAVFSFIAPIIYMCALGFLLSALCLYFATRYFLRLNAFEHAIASWGCSTGVFLTGILLLRVCDPEQKTPTLGNYSLGYSLSGVAFFALLPSILGFVASHGAFWGMIYCLAAAFFSAFFIIAGKKLC